MKATQLVHKPHLFVSLLRRQLQTVDVVMDVDSAITAAMRRRQRRLRQFLRHKRLSVAMALKEKLHHTPRGQRLASSGRKGHEEHDALRRQKPPPPQAFFRLYDEEDAEWGARPGSVTDPGRRCGSSGSSWSILQTLPPWCKFSMLLCRRRRKSWRTS